MAIPAGVSDRRGRELPTLVTGKCGLANQALTGPRESAADGSASDGSAVGASAPEPSSVGDTSLRELRFVHPQATLLPGAPSFSAPLSQHTCWSQASEI